MKKINEINILNDFSNIRIFLLFSALTNVHVVSQLPKPYDNVNPCDHERPGMLYYKTAVYNNDTCFFTIKHATSTVNRWSFEIAEAKEHCNKYNATLPRVKSIEKNQFIVNTFTDLAMFVNMTDTNPDVWYLEGIALDIWAGRNQFVWGDGTTVIAPVPVRRGSITNQFKHAVIQMTEAEDVEVGEWNYNNTLETLFAKRPYYAFGDLTDVKHGGVLCEMPWTPGPDIQLSDEQKSHLKLFGVRDCFIFGNVCYFVMSQTSYKSNARGVYSNITDLEYDFGIATVKAACEHKNAYLPIIESEYENNFVNQLKFPIFNEPGWQHAGILLGINIYRNKSTILPSPPDNGKYVWSNGQDLLYQPQNWKQTTDRRYSYFYYYTYMLRNETAGPTWIDVDDDNPSTPEPITIVCKKYRFGDTNQAYQGIRLPMTPCDQGNTSKFTKTAVYKNVCYFIVDGATDKAHTNTSVSGQLLFSRQMAEESCATENAWTLTIDDDASVVSFIKSTFNGSDFSRNLLSGIYLGIEVGPCHKMFLSPYEVMKWKTNGRYYWTADPNLEVDMNTFGGQLKWTKMTSSYNFTYLDWDSYEWFDSSDTLYHNTYIAVLCMKNLVFEKTSPATPTTSTTKRIRTRKVKTTTEPQTTKTSEAISSTEPTSGQTTSAVKGIDHEGFMKVVFVMVPVVTKISV